MQQEKVILEFTRAARVFRQDIDFKISKSYYLNSLNTLSGASKIELIFKNVDNLNSMSSLIGQFEDVSVYLSSLNNNLQETYKKLLMKGIVLNKRSQITTTKICLNIEISHKTYLYRLYYSPAFTIFAKENAVSTIKELFNKTYKFYDRLITPLSSTQLSNSFKKKIESTLITAESDTIYNSLEMILNDTNSQVFTTITNTDKTTLYIYDTGQFVAGSTQRITKHNFKSMEVDINYTKLFNRVETDSESTVGGYVNLNQVGQKATIGKSQVGNVNRLTSPFGVKINKNSIDIPDLVFKKVLKNSSDPFDIKEYALFVLRNFFNEAINITITTYSMFIDLQNPSLGLWELGQKIEIDNDILIKFLQNSEIRNYLQSNKYFFVLKGISMNEIGDVELIIGLNDLIRI